MEGNFGRHCIQICSKGYRVHLHWSPIYQPSINNTSTTWRYTMNKKKRMHSIAHLNIKVNQIKSLFRTFCSLLNQHTLDSMIIQVMSQEIHIVDSLCNSLLWLDTALLVNVHGYHLHNQWLLVSLSNCLISHTYIEVFLFLMSKMSNTLFARCWTGTDLLLISLGVYPFYFGIIPLGFTPLGVVGYFRDWLTTVQHQPKRIVRAAPPPKKQSLGNNGPNTHTSENCWSLRTPAPFLEGIKQ